MSETEVQARAREIAERLNAIRQGWEITLRHYPSSYANLSDVNTLAGVLAEVLHVLAYGEAERGSRRE